MPAWFTEVVNSGWMSPCKALDVGCGVGNYAFHLAQKGYEILCIDHSETAICARERKKQPSVFTIYGRRHGKPERPWRDNLISSMTSRYSIICNPGKEMSTRFNLSSLLHPGGKLMVCVFCDDEARFGKTNEFMNPVTGTITSLLWKEELVKMFDPYFTFDKLEKVPFDNYLRHLCLMRKKYIGYNDRCSLRGSGFLSSYKRQGNLRTNPVYFSWKASDKNPLSKHPSPLMGRGPW